MRVLLSLSEIPLDCALHGIVVVYDIPFGVR